MNEPELLIYYNEACAACGIPADLHLSLHDAPRTSPHAVWGGDRNRCRVFVRYDPPRPAYGNAWWEEKKK
jgi:hypothetical protein